MIGQLSLIDRGANFVSGCYIFEGSEAKIMPPGRIASTFDLLCNTNVGTSTIIMRRDLLGDDRFKNYWSSQDTDLWARLAGKVGFIYGHYDLPVTMYFRSLRTSNKLRQFKFFRQMILGFSLPLTARIQIYLRYALRGFINHYWKRGQAFANRSK